VFGVAATGWMLESDRRKARKQAIHDVEVSYRAISKLFEAWTSKENAT